MAAIVLPPARRIGQRLGSDPSAEAGDRSMGPYNSCGPLFYTLVHNALNPGGHGGLAPHNRYGFSGMTRIHGPVYESFSSVALCLS